MRIFLFCLLVFSAYQSQAQQAVVPAKMEFAGIKLRIMDDARKEIQKDVDALTASPRYFEIKAERARTYFPIIERVFREENLPDDFKYLSLQESALISDAVSTSNAVGFWQFKDFTAVEVGLRVDKTVDERKNIVSSSRGAARYMKNNNQFFDNWLHALQAYQMGAGGAMKVLDKGHEGSKSMVINKKTYWYVKKYLAHKIAFEGVASRPGQIEVSEYYNGEGKTLKEIANENDLDENEVVEYNKWLSKGKIPNDKKYAVILPKAGLGTEDTSDVIAVAEDVEKGIDYQFDEPGEFPKIEDPVDARAGKIVEINGLPGIVASRTDRIPALAAKADISLRKFLKYNDLGIDGVLIPGQVYYMKAKRSKAKAYYHVVEEGESLWSISQKFGIKLKKLKAKNRIKNETKLKPGRVLWIRYVRPANVAIEFNEVESKPVEATITKNETEIVLPIVESEISEDPIPTVVKVDSALSVEIDSTATIVDNEVVMADSSEEVLEANLPGDSVEVEEEPVLQEELIDITAKQDADSVDQIRIKKVHEVQMGETYYAISRQYRVAVLDLLEWNSLKISDKLSIGQKLVVMVPEAESPVIKESSSKQITHTVTEGDTLYSIARKYGVSVQELLSWNSKEDTSIKLGEKLIISN